MVAERDAWLLQREARIASLETTISEMERMLRERGRLADAEIARREETVRERERRIAWLEYRVRRLETPRLPPRTDDLCARIKELVARLPGWCCEKKLWMADRILEYGYKSAAELGVYGGRSVFPIALAIAKNNSHAVHAVDAWDNSVATSFSIDKPDDVWWEEVDLIAIKSSFLREMVSQNLAGLIKILELPSAEAYHIAAGKIVKSIDFLHIDGGHSEDQALSDARNWSTLVASGGMIVLDDIHWSGVQSADEFLAARFERVEEVKTDGTAFAAYRV